MKVAYIVNIFPSISQTFILNEVLEVQKNGMDVCVFSCARGEEVNTHQSVQDVSVVSFLHNNNIFKVIYGHFYWFIKKPNRYVKLLWIAVLSDLRFKKRFLLKLFDLISIERFVPHHIHAHFGTRPADLAMMMHILTSVSFTFTTHRTDIFDQPPKNYQLKSRLAKKHITVSLFNKHFICETFGVLPEQISVIHCGIDLSRFRADSITKHSNRIVSVARLEEQKCLDRLIKACKALHDRGIDFECLIIGGGSLRPILQGDIDKYSLSDKVRLMGSQVQDRVVDLVKSSALMVLPSKSEGIPVALMEAMALKVPVIGPDVCGVPELIQNEISGFLVAPTDDDDLVHKIGRLLLDRDLQKVFAERGYEIIEEAFNLKVETQKLIHVWQDRSERWTPVSGQGTCSDK